MQAYSVTYTCYSRLNIENWLPERHLQDLYDEEVYKTLMINKTDLHRRPIGPDCKETMRLAHLLDLVYRRVSLVPCFPFVRPFYIKRKEEQECLKTQYAYKSYTKIMHTCWRQSIYLTDFLFAFFWESTLLTSTTGHISSGRCGCSQGQMSQ